MKKTKLIILTCLSVVLFSVTTQSQQLEIGNNYYFITDQGISSISKMTEIKISDDKKVNSEEAIIEIRRNHRIKIIDIKDEVVYFKYLKFQEIEDDSLSKTDKKKKDYYIYNRDIDNDKTKIFSMSENNFEKLTNNFYSFFRGFKYGTYTVPIRLRDTGDEFEFDSNLSLGANIIGRFGFNRSKENLFFDISLGIGLTKVNLNRENSILGKEDTDFAKIDVLSPTALTVSVGVLLNLAKNVNIGAYFGWDRLSSADNKAEWDYNKKTWFGIGLNVNFIGNANNSSSSSASN